MNQLIAGGAALTLVIAIAVVLLRREQQQLRVARNALHQLAESEQRLARALRGSDDGLWDWNIMHGTGWYSPRWWTMLGYEPNELSSDVGLWKLLAHPNHQDTIPNTIAQLMAGTDDHCVFEFELRHKAGHYVPILARCYIERDSNGVALRLSGSTTDVTERRRVAQAREQFERKLQETQKLESLGVLAGGIAHDFNNLLTGVLGNASLAMNDVPPSSRTYTYLTEINEAASRAAELCRQMLAYSGRGRFVVSRVTLNEIIEQTIQLLQLSIANNAVLRFQLGESLPPIEADATQVRQVIMNLVINASEALGDKGGVITVSTGLTRVDSAYLRGTHLATAIDGGNYVHLEVADTGIGMAPDVQSRIFEPFYTTKFTGRGLGLAAVLGIVRGHGGTLKVYSEINRGSTFKMLFPAAAGEAEVVANNASREPWKGSGNILVVDDEPAVRRTVSRMLELMGFTTVEANDGAHAVELFRARPDEIAMVMLDLTMPRLDGEQTYAELRRLKPSVRVVLMSGFNQQEAIARFTGKGLASFLQKPFSLETLRDAVQGAYRAL
ncbi:MAG: response regulator [Gemmatimonadaceae bacterium]